MNTVYIKVFRKDGRLTAYKVCGEQSLLLQYS